MKNIYLLAGLLFCNCYDNKNTTTTTTNDNIEYYKNGNVKYIQLNNNKGEAIATATFYENGALKYQREYNSSGKLSKTLLYDSLNNLVEEEQYQQTSYMSSFENQKKTYDKSGKIIESKSRYIEIESEKDTFKIGDPIEIKLKIHDSTVYNSVKIIYGDGIDKFYNIMDTSKIIIRDIENPNQIIRIQANNLGSNSIRGIIYQKKISKPLVYTLNPMCFEYEYFVKSDATVGFLEGNFARYFEKLEIDARNYKSNK